MNKNSVTLDHINFTVANFHESTNWYQKIFNFELVEEGVNQEGRRWGILRSGNSMLAISEHPNKKINDGEDFHKMYHFALRLTDPIVWKEKIDEHNIKVYYSGPLKYPNSTSWYIKDPTGNEIEVTIWDNNTIKFN